MKLESSEKAGVKIVVLKGKIMGSPDETSLTDVIYEFAEKGKTKVVLDLSGVTWMNSRALGMCIGGLTTLRNRGGDLRLCCVSKPVDSLIRKCHLHTVFQSFDSTEEAVRSFS
jgi:anti-sigma B factor antagonist